MMSLELVIEIEEVGVCVPSLPSRQKLSKTQSQPQCNLWEEFKNQGNTDTEICQA